MSAGSPHLELEELLAEVNGEAAGDRVRVHLAICRACRAEAECWRAVAGGVRHLAAATPVPLWLPGEVLASTRQPGPSSLRHARLLRPRAGADRRPGRAVVATAAALVLVAGAVSYGLTRESGGDRNLGPVSAAGLTGVNGCSGLVAALGRVKETNGASLVIRTPGGQPVRVTTSATTAVSRAVTGSVSAITDGGLVFVRGIYSRGMIAARSISVGVTPTLPVLRFGRRRHARAPWIGAGTVQDASAGSFILIVPGGARVPVTVSGSATVFTLARADLSQLRAGDYVVAVGKAGPGGSLAATTVEEGKPLPHNRGNGISSLPRIGCQSSTVATAALISAS